MTTQCIDTSRLFSKLSRHESAAAADVVALQEFYLAVEFGSVPDELATQDQISQQVQAGLREVDVQGDVDFALPNQAVATLRLIRDLTSCSVRVKWSLQARGFAVDKLFALQPPREHPDAMTLEAWRSGFRFGLLYWRAGPGFVIVRDARRAAINYFTLNEPGYLDAVQRGHLGEGLVDVDADALSALEEEGLVYRIDGEAVFLPYRMRHWPVPFNSV